MRMIAREKITLCVIIGLLLFTTSASVMTTGVLQHKAPERIKMSGVAYTPHDAILLDGNAEMIVQATAESWLGDGSEENPYQITGYSFYDVEHSVEIRNIDLHWEFTDNYVDGPYDTTVWCGVEISNSSNGYVANNIITGRFRGLWLIDIYDVTITHNYIHTNLFHAIECIGFVNACLISDNTLTGNDGSGIRIFQAVDSEISGNNITASDGTGIQVMSTTETCQITDNTIKTLTGLGIHLRRGTSVEVMHNEITDVAGDGLYIQESNTIEVYNNTIRNGGNKGMVFTDSEFGLVHNNSIITSDVIGISMISGMNMTFKFNRIEDSTEYGLVTGADTEFNMITRNVFLNNGVLAQVCDDGENNTYIYNYYDEWTTPDIDSDLIVDSPYVIDGDSERTDPYPLADPNAVPPVTEKSTATSGTESENIGQFSMELVLIAGGAVVIILVGVFFVKRR